MGGTRSSSRDWTTSGEPHEDDQQEQADEEDPLFVGLDLDDSMFGNGEDDQQVQQEQIDMEVDSLIEDVKVQGGHSAAQASSAPRTAAAR